MRFRAIHRHIRAVTRHYPFRRLAPQFSALMGYLFPPPDPLWLVSEPCGAAPFLELNLSHPHQRKIYYFPRAWANYWMSEPFPRFLRQTATPGMTFVDIGAHLGFFSFYAAALLGPAGRVIAFEPDPDLYEALVRSARLNHPDRILCANTALSDTTGQAVFYRAKKPASSSLVPEKPGREHRYHDTITVACQRFDDYMKEREGDLRTLRLIKCDVEGHEVQVVSGMLETLVRAAFPTLWIEVRGPGGSTRAPNTFEAVNRMLSGLGYTPFLWADGRYVPVTDGGGLKRTDVVFRHAEHREEG
jgi:FkbM family methyltransferase